MEMFFPCQNSLDFETFSLSKQFLMPILVSFSSNLFSVRFGVINKKPRKKIMEICQNTEY